MGGWAGFNEVGWLIDLSFHSLIFLGEKRVYFVGEENETDVNSAQVT